MITVIHGHSLLDELFDGKTNIFGEDFDIYRNHCFRVFNFASVLSARNGENPDAADKIAVASFFHDYGIWAESTFDYLLPSQKLAALYLRENDLGGWCDEVWEMIGWHHKLTPYRAHPSWLVEPFRKADWIDITGGMLRFRLPDVFVAEVMDVFPVTGFHRMLAKLALNRVKTRPFNPLPMMRL
jgi:hypothetical protein